MFDFLKKNISDINLLKEARFCVDILKKKIKLLFAYALAGFRLSFFFCGGKSFFVDRDEFRKYFLKFVFFRIVSVITLPIHLLSALVGLFIYFYNEWVYMFLKNFHDPNGAFSRQSSSQNNSPGFSPSSPNSSIKLEINPNNRRRDLFFVANALRALNELPQGSNSNSDPENNTLETNSPRFSPRSSQ